VLRPHVEVTTTTLDDLEGEVARLKPHVVLSSGEEPVTPPHGVVWATIPIEFDPSSSKLTLATLLEIIDGTEERRAPTALEAEQGNP
jgi:hypothetical protein